MRLSVEAEGPYAPKTLPRILGMSPEQFAVRNGNGGGVLEVAFYHTLGLPSFEGRIVGDGLVIGERTGRRIFAFGLAICCSSHAVDVGQVFGTALKTQTTPLKEVWRLEDSGRFNRVGVVADERMKLDKPVLVQLGRGKVLIVDQEDLENPDELMKIEGFVRSKRQVPLGRV